MPVRDFVHNLFSPALEKFIADKDKDAQQKLWSILNTIPIGKKVAWEVQEDHIDQEFKKIAEGISHAYFSGFVDSFIEGDKKSGYKYTVIPNDGRMVSNRMYEIATKGNMLSITPRERGRTLSDLMD